MTDKNMIKISTMSNGKELMISAPSTKQFITATNNKAQYYAEQAKQYRDQAKAFADQNSDVTMEYVETLRENLLNEINKKQPIGNYALKEEIPSNVSELENDSNYVTESVLYIAVPSQINNAGKILYTDGNNTSWVYIDGFLANINQQIALINTEISKINTEKLDVNHSNASFPYLKEVYVNGTSWYRIWSNGWKEQGGRTYVGASSVPVTFIKSFSDANYTVLVAPNTTQGAGGVSTSVGVMSDSQTKTGFTVSQYSKYIFAYWYACGY